MSGVGFQSAAQLILLYYEVVNVQKCINTVDIPVNFIPALKLQNVRIITGQILYSGRKKNKLHSATGNYIRYI